MSLFNIKEGIQQHDAAVKGGFDWGVKTCVEELQKLSGEYRENKIWEHAVLIDMVARILEARFRDFDEVKFKAYIAMSYNKELMP